MPPAENLAKSTPRDQFTAGGRFRILNKRVRAFFQAASACATAVGTSMALAAGRGPFRVPVGSARATERPTRSAIGLWVGYAATTGPFGRWHDHTPEIDRWSLLARNIRHRLGIAASGPRWSAAER